MVKRGMQVNEKKERCRGEYELVVGERKRNKDKGEKHTSEKVDGVSRSSVEGRCSQ